jgi:hypothetical protein
MYSARHLKLLRIAPVDEIFFLQNELQNVPTEHDTFLAQKAARDFFSQSSFLTFINKQCAIYKKLHTVYL